MMLNEEMKWLMALHLNCTLVGVMWVKITVESQERNNVWKKGGVFRLLDGECSEDKCSIFL